MYQVLATALLGVLLLAMANVFEEVLEEGFRDDY